MRLLRTLGRIDTVSAHPVVTKFPGLCSCDKILDKRVLSLQFNIDDISSTTPFSNFRFTERHERT